MMTKKSLLNFSTRKLLVAPSVLAADFACLGEEITRVENAGCDIIHLDVMDGHFVPNLTIGPPLIKSIRKITDLPFDTHLMITDPLKYVKFFADAGSDSINFHVEANDNPEEVIKAIRAEGCSVGMTLKPKTPAEAIFPYLDKIDMVLVMTVEPGFGGQSFMPDMMPKVTAIKNAISKVSNQVHIEVDGGIDAQNVETVAKAGANIVVAGTSVFRNPEGAAKAIADLHQAEKYL
jgi:ribulose-phosphate 3-epimerase